LALIATFKANKANKANKAKFFGHAITTGYTKEI
jgi:hypothetical protein